MGIFDMFRSKSQPQTSARVARDRLLTVLVHDRVKLSPELLEQMRSELAAVIMRYVPSVNPEEIEVTLLRGEGNESADRLKADVPLRRVQDDSAYPHS